MKEQYIYILQQLISHHAVSYELIGKAKDLAARGCDVTAILLGIIFRT